MGQNHQEHHIISSKILLNVCIALFALTVLTVLTAKGIHLGLLAGPVAFLIASVKAYMVMAYFMGLKYDDKSNRLIFASGFAFLLLLFFLCALDIFTRIQTTSTL